MKRRTQQSLLKKAKFLFRKSIRKRDTNKKGFGKCITCKVRVHINSSNAGHFVHRVNATYFLEENCHIQCIRCNNYLHGNLWEYGKAIDKKYGKGKADALIALGKTTKQFTCQELEEMIKKYAKNNI